MDRYNEAPMLWCKGSPGGNFGIQQTTTPWQYIATSSGFNCLLVKIYAFASGSMTSNASCVKKRRSSLTKFANDWLRHAASHASKPVTKPLIFFLTARHVRLKGIIKGTIYNVLTNWTPGMFLEGNANGSCFPEFGAIQEEVLATIIPRLFHLLNFGKNQKKKKQTNKKQ